MKIEFATMAVLFFSLCLFATTPLHTIILIHPNNFEANTLIHTLNPLSYASHPELFFPSSPPLINICPARQHTYSTTSQSATK